MHTELCRQLIRKFLDTILTNKLQSIETAIELFDMVFENKLLDDKDFNDYIGTALVDLYSRYPIEMDKYVNRYGDFQKKINRDFKSSISHTLRSLYFFYKYLQKESHDYIPSHFQQSLLFVLNFTTQINDIICLSNDELNEINHIISLLTEKDSIQRQNNIYENKHLIINCIEKYLYHIAKIPSQASYIKECVDQYHLQIHDKWDHPDAKLIELIGFPQIEKDAMELFKSDDFLTNCMDVGANMIYGDIPLKIRILNTQDEFINQLKVKYPDIERFLPYMKIKKEAPLEGGLQ